MFVSWLASACISTGECIDKAGNNVAVGGDLFALRTMAEQARMAAPLPLQSLANAYFLSFPSASTNTTIAAVATDTSNHHLLLLLSYLYVCYWLD